MKFLTFIPPHAPEAGSKQSDKTRLGAWLSGAVIDLRSSRLWAYAVRRLPLAPLAGTMYDLIQGGEQMWAYARDLVSALEGEDSLSLRCSDGAPVAYPPGEVLLYPPLPRPMSLRDFYSFEQHVKAAFALRGNPVPPEWYQFPAFYFSNANAIFGSGEAIPYPAYTQELDYELEVACVIGKAGINIPPGEAERTIFGYTLLNDWSARDVQRQERKIGLGPAKGKDFATSMGPWIVTPDELADRSTGRLGVYDLRLCARVNGVERSSANWKDIHYSFGEMIARASQDVYLLPGDVLGSGTVGGGCLLELTGGQGPWLQPGDRVELEGERLGVLQNRPVRLSNQPTLAKVPMEGSSEGNLR
jgi:fumarylacetoacetate (FAA) hydrolase